MTEYGRIKILTDIKLTGNVESDKLKIPVIIENSLPFHNQNKESYTKNKQWYFNDTQKILDKVKHVRPEIDNKFTFSVPRTVVKNNNGYCFAVPFKYVTSESDENKIEQMGAFNKCLNAVNNHKHTLVCTRNAGIYGIGYKLALNPTNEQLKNGIFFDISSDIDNFNSFIVYSNDISKEEILSVIYFDRKQLDPETGLSTNNVETVYNVWDRWHRWTFIRDNKNAWTNKMFENISVAGELKNLIAFPLKIDINANSQAMNIPLQEYERSADRVGDFELSCQLMNAINTLASCRLDSVQQSTDFIIKLRDIDLGEFDENGNNPVMERIKQYMVNHFLAVESRDDATAQPDIDVLDIPLNQSEVQTLQDYLYEMLETELCQPSRSGGSGQDTGVAVENRNGFRQLENNCVDITDFTIDAELKFIEKLLEIGKLYAGCPFKDLTIADITIQSMRNRSENLSLSTTNFREMRKSGVNPYTAYSTSGLVADVVDTVKLDQEWKQKEADFILEQELKREKELQKIQPVKEVVEETEIVEDI